ncbi:C4-dicarboxylate ABC transporter permease [Donghicola sp. C2-DW-16]|uniref:C4-dicarboxylate ABC transporter permease n=1 Tax=Donghicola mangrovi TaxID=2729614 RepID=A0A850Q236_9RHOB|nr:C4-dicarboxylate ABC transporter permease [Donghicola mangrovi]NVO23677.1 C4-dicarboxylate ABC transporter permease [Donghicola mangrovi]NVO26866.1 C4-dicarboxylate ABC transporter permease [Donghicola mangrovi]
MEQESIGLGGALLSVWDGLVWALSNIAMAFYNFFYAVSHPGLWLDWSNKESLVRFVYYGGSVEFFFVIFTTFLLLTAIGVWKNNFMWACVRGLEAFANAAGRFAAWAGLIMVLQQTVIVLMQRIFARPDVVLGFGIPIGFDVSWWSEELKLWNAIVVAMCVSYTFVQGGHVRVDLIYASVSHRTQRVMDMVGTMIFMMPLATIIWMYGWFFLWRHLIVPKPSASDQLDRMVMKARALRWNVETIGFSANGFTGYFLFKILLVTFAGMVFLHACAFFWRSYLEFKEGPDSAGRFVDRDTLGEGEEAYEGTH